MIDFWDIDFDSDSLVTDLDFIEGLLKLGFEKKSDSIFVKEVVNNYGDLIKDGVLVDLVEKKIVYFPEPNCTVKMDIEDTDIDKIDNFLRNNTI
jgi:hypothetical protein